MIIQRRWLQPFFRPWRDAHNTHKCTLGSFCKFYLQWFGLSHVPSLTFGIQFGMDRLKFGRMRCIFQFLMTQTLVFLTTGETSESLHRLTRTNRHLSLNETGRYYTLSPVNRVKLYMMLLRSYPSYHNLARIVNVGVATLHNVKNWCILIKKRALLHFVQWLTITE